MATMARAFGFEALSCASTGNLANAAAAHRPGRHALLRVRPRRPRGAKILATETYGAKVVAVKGNYDDVNRLCAEVADALPWAFVNVNMRPYYAEGSKPSASRRPSSSAGACPTTSSSRPRAARSSRRSIARSRS